MTDWHVRPVRRFVTNCQPMTKYVTYNHDENHIKCDRQCIRFCWCCMTNLVALLFHQYNKVVLCYSWWPASGPWYKDNKPSLSCAGTKVNKLFFMGICHIQMLLDLILDWGYLFFLSQENIPQFVLFVYMFNLFSTLNIMT